MLQLGPAILKQSMPYTGQILHLTRSGYIWDGIGYTLSRDTPAIFGLLRCGCTARIRFSSGTEHTSIEYVSNVMIYIASKLSACSRIYR